MHGVIRRYRVRLGTMEQAVHYVDKWFVPLVRDIPGFSAQYLMAEEPQTLTCVGMFETAEGARSADRLAAEWFGKEWGSFRALPPETIGGEVKLEAVASSGGQRRRRLSDRRRSRDAALRPGERRSGTERRATGGLDMAIVELRAVG